MDDPEKIQQLEARLASRPNSPLFARLAASLLDQGEVARAIELCEKGMEEYPVYTTGYLIAAQCYRAAGQIPEAERALRYILKHHTRHTGALQLLEDIKNSKGAGIFSQASYTQAFDAFAETMRAGLSGQGKTLELEEFLSMTPGDGGTIETLAASLEGAKISPLPPEDSSYQEPGGGNEPSSPDPSIATVTLADIYERQGQYAEAIATYKILIEQNPEEGARYWQKIEDLQKLLELRGFGF